MPMILAFVRWRQKNQEFKNSFSWSTGDLVPHPQRKIKCKIKAWWDGSVSKRLASPTWQPKSDPQNPFKGRRTGAATLSSGLHVPWGKRPATRCTRLTIYRHLKIRFKKFISLWEPSVYYSLQNVLHQILMTRSFHCSNNNSYRNPPQRIYRSLSVKTLLGSSSLTVLDTAYNQACSLNRTKDSPEARSYTLFRLEGVLDQDKASLFGGKNYLFMASYK